MAKRIQWILLCLLMAWNGAAQINTKRMMEIGKNAIYFEDYVLAIQYFNRVINAKPYLAEPYFYRAVAKISLEDYVGAERDCDLALERNPFVVDAYRCRGAARVSMDRYDEALTDFDRGLELEPHNKYFALFKGSVYACQEKWDTAISVYSDLIKRHANFKEAYLRRGYALFSKGDTLQALQDFDALLNMDRFSADAHAARGYVLGVMKDYDRGIAELNEAIRLDPFCVGYYINRGAVWVGAGDSIKALSDYDSAIQLDPSCTSAYFNRAILRTKAGELKLALEDYNQVVDLEPGNYFAIFNRAILSNQMGRYKAAVKDLTSIIEAYPDYYPAYQMRAEVKAKMKDKQGSEIDRNTAFVIQRKLENQSDKQSDKKLEDLTAPKKKKDLARHGDLVVMDKREEMRRLSYKSESRGRVQNVNFRINLSPMLKLTTHPKKKSTEETKYGYYEKLVDAFNTAKVAPFKLRLTEESFPSGIEEGAFATIDSLTNQLEKHPSARALLARALCHDAVSDWTSAMEDFSAAIDLGGDEYRWIAHFYRGTIRYEQYMMRSNFEGEDMLQVQSVVFDLVLKDFEQTLGLAPDFAPAWFNYGFMLVAQGRYADAIVAFTKAIELSPNMAEAYYNRGLTYLYLKKNPEGVADLSKAGELGIYSAYNVIKRFGEKN